MPKVALTERQKDFQRLGYNLKMLQGGRTKQEMADLMDVSLSTYRRRTIHPEELTYSEIKRLCDFAGVNIQTFLCGTLRFC